MSEGKSVKLPEEFDSDPWVAGFICELYNFYGVQPIGENCISKPEKIQYLWATIGIANALRLEEPMWRAMRGRIDPKIAAEEFSRRYYNIRKKMVIEGAPTFLDKISELGSKSKMLPDNSKEAK